MSDRTDPSNQQNPKFLWKPTRNDGAWTRRCHVNKDLDKPKPGTTALKFPAKGSLKVTIQQKKVEL